MSIACASFANLASVYVIADVQTIDQTRRQRLEFLISKYGSIAALNVAMEMDRTDATFSQIRNQSLHSKSGKPRVMGDDLARKIEDTLGLERGWMDTPPGLEQASKLHRVAERLAPYQVEQLIAIGETLARNPAAAEGIRQNNSTVAEKSSDTVQAGTSAAEGPALVHSAAARAGGHLDPSRPKQKNGAVHEREQAGRRPGKGDGGRR